MKVCTKCHREKDESEFVKDRSKKDGLACWCTVCRKQYKSAHLEVHKEVLNAKHRRKRLENIGVVREKDQRYRDSNREAIRDYQKGWYERRDSSWIEKKKRHNKAYYQEHRDEYIKRQSRYHARRLSSDPFFRLKCKVRTLIGNAIKRQGYTKNSKTQQLLQCSYEELLIHLGPQPDCDAHIDHICPCAQAQNEKELVKLQHHSNLRWLSAEENNSKKAHKTSEAEEMCRRLLGREWI